MRLTARSPMNSNKSLFSSERGTQFRARFRSDSFSRGTSFGRGRALYCIKCSRKVVGTNVVVTEGLGDLVPADILLVTVAGVMIGVPYSGGVG